jgi:hypothetical protein
MRTASTRSSLGGISSRAAHLIYQLSLFHRNPTTNQYAQLNYGQDGVFLGIEFYAYFFEALGRSGSALPDIIACQDSSRLAVLENHGGLNFSISGVAFSSVVLRRTIHSNRGGRHRPRRKRRSILILPSATISSLVSRIRRSFLPPRAFLFYRCCRTPPELSPTSMATRIRT